MDLTGEAVATARAFARQARAIRVVLLIDRGEERAALLVDLDEAGDAEVTDDDVLTVIPRTAPTPPPRPLPELRATPASAISIDPETAELSAPIGTIDHLADAVTALAAAFGRRTVASAEFATRDPDLPIAIAARPGEPPVLSAGGEEFQL
jgi:hypothetical protein